MNHYLTEGVGNPPSPVSIKRWLDAVCGQNTPMSLAFPDPGAEFEHVRKNRVLIAQYLNNRHNDANFQEGRLFVDSMLRFLASAALARAIEEKQSGDVSNWFREVAACAGVDLVPDYTLPEGDNLLERVEVGFRDLLVRDPRIGEAWDTVRRKSGMPAPSPLRVPADLVRRVRIRVLGATGTAPNDQGMVGSLDLEWLPEKGLDGVRWQRHPDSLLLPCDTAFQDTFDVSLKAVSDRLGQNWSGTVRWRLEFSGHRLPIVTGDSMGLALGIGLDLLWTNRSGDDTIAVTGALTPEGSTGAVGSIKAKLDAAAKDSNIRIVLLPDDLTGVDSAKIDEINRDRYRYKRIKTLYGDSSRVDSSNGDSFGVDLSGIEEYKRWNRVRDAVREKVFKENQNFEVLHRTLSLQKVSFDQDLFLPIPLMKEIPISKLEEMERQRRQRGEGEPGERETMRPPSLAWTEREMGREDRKFESPVDILSLFTSSWSGSDARRVLLGEPGGGKSTLVKWLCWKMAHPTEPLLVNGKSLLPIPIRLREWTTDRYRTMDLATFLEAQYRGLPDPPTKRMWQDWLELGELFLLVDGLDEADNEILKRVSEELSGEDAEGKKANNTGGKKANSCPALLTCRNFHRERIEEWKKRNTPIYGFTALDRARQRQYVTNYPACQYSVDELLAELEESKVSGMAGNPLLLSVLCYIADQQPGGGTLPATRTKVYDEAVSIMFNTMHESMRTDSAARANPAGTNADSEASNSAAPPYTVLLPVIKRELLEDLVLAVAKSDPQRLIFKAYSKPSASTDVDAVATDLCKRRFGQSGEVIASYMLELLPKYTRLLSTYQGESKSQGASESGYSVLHRSFQDFLTACALARQAGSPTPNVPYESDRANFVQTANWTALHWQRAYAAIDRAKGDAIENLNPLYRYIAFLDRRCWHPDWHETFLFLAGKMEDPALLLDLLCCPFDNPKINRDDIFCHRLALAAECLGEIDWKKMLGDETEPA